MVEYNVTEIPGIGLQVQGNFPTGSTPVNIPENEEKRKEFISLFLQKADIEFGIDSLRCISIDKSPLINKALFTAALSSLMKCFQGSKVCEKLDSVQFKSENSALAVQFDKYKSWRDKHFLHEENGMTQAVAFLPVAPEGYGEALCGMPSVVWSRVKIDYYQEAKQLETLMQAVWGYVVHNIDSIGDYMIKKYCVKSREELLSYGVAGIKMCSTENPDKTRTLKQTEDM